MDAVWVWLTYYYKKCCSHTGHWKFSSEGHAATGRFWKVTVVTLVAAVSIAL